MQYTYKNGDTVTWNREIFNKCPFKNSRVAKITEIRDNRFIGLEGIRCWWYWYELQPTKEVPIYRRIKYWITFWHWYLKKYYKECKPRVKC